MTDEHVCTSHIQQLCSLLQLFIIAASYIWTQHRKDAIYNILHSQLQTHDDVLGSIHSHTCMQGDI